MNFFWEQKGKAVEHGRHQEGAPEGGIAAYEDGGHEDSHKVEGKEVQMEAFVDKAVQDSGSSGDKTAEYLQKLAHFLYIHAKGCGQILIDEDRRSRLAEPRTVEAVDEEAHEQHQAVENRQYYVAMRRRRVPYVGQPEHSHGSAHGGQIFDYRPGYVNEGKTDYYHREGGSVAYEEGDDIADYSAYGETDEEGPEKGQLQAHHQETGQVAGDSHVRDGDKVQMRDPVGQVNRPGHEDVHRGNSKKVIYR
ncbi:hypothetical protein SDC9_31669 [bioreactor metagenome]|uniref:Uncharacterized protein n=1 Tax=bioreactor metagenome TaxID=1076179 RepID=A0A644V2Y2_9ZZZZ